MQKFATGTCLALALLTGFVEAGSYIYQPTPYPKKKFGGADMPQDLKVVHFWEGTKYECTWCNNEVGIYNFQENEILRIGGWGDNYAPMIRFDLTGLPNSVDNAYFFLNRIPSGSPLPSQVSWFPILSDWNPTYVPYVQNMSFGNGYLDAVVTSTGWRGYYITNWYNQWKAGTLAENGLIFWPQNGDGQNRFDHFKSSRNADVENRPLILLEFEPTLQLKMPLDYDLRWLVTTEVGGYDCKGAYDQYHDGNNYFSVDFSWRSNTSGYPNPDPGQNKLNNGVYIPVRAAASGIVMTSGYSAGNGNYVVIDHDWDGNNTTGFQTWYLHLQPGWQIANGTHVQYGEVIGYMGNTGISSGAHLHFGVRYQNIGTKDTPQLAKVIMENKLLKSYQTECSVSSSGEPFDWNKYYP